MAINTEVLVCVLLAGGVGFLIYNASSGKEQPLVMMDEGDDPEDGFLANGLRRFEDEKLDNCLTDLKQLSADYKGLHAEAQKSIEAGDIESNGKFPTWLGDRLDTFRGKLHDIEDLSTNLKELVRGVDGRVTEIDENLPRLMKATDDLLRMEKHESRSVHFSQTQNVQNFNAMKITAATNPNEQAANNEIRNNFSQGPNGDLMNPVFNALEAGNQGGAAEAVDKLNGVLLLKDKSVVVGEDSAFNQAPGKANAVTNQAESRETAALQQSQRGLTGNMPPGKKPERMRARSKSPVRNKEKGSKRDRSRERDADDHDTKEGLEKRIVILADPKPKPGPPAQSYLMIEDRKQELTAPPGASSAGIPPNVKQAPEDEGETKAFFQDKPAGSGKLVVPSANPEDLRAAADIMARSQALNDGDDLKADQIAQRRHNRRVVDPSTEAANMITSPVTRETLRTTLNAVVKEIRTTTGVSKSTMKKLSDGVPPTALTRARMKTLREMIRDAEPEDVTLKKTWRPYYDYAVRAERMYSGKGTPRERDSEGMANQGNPKRQRQ